MNGSHRSARMGFLSSHFRQKVQDGVLMLVWSCVFYILGAPNKISNPCTVRKKESHFVPLLVPGAGSSIVPLAVGNCIL